MRLRHAFAVAASLVSVYPGTSLAQAQLTVAVAPFDGRGARTVTRDVAGALGDHADVVSSRTASRAATQAGIEGLSGGITDFATAVGAQIVFLGTVETTGRRRRRRRRRRGASTRQVSITAFDAGGEQLAQANFSYPSGRSGRETLAGEVAALFQQAVSAREALHAPPPALDPAPMFEPEPEPEPESEAPDDGLAILSAWIGLTIRSRDTVVTLTTPGDERRYSASYVELGAAVEARPFAREGHLGRGLYANIDFWHSVGLGSVVDDPAMTSVASTNFARFQINAGYLLTVAEIAEVGIGFGGGYDGYFFAVNPILPTAEIGYLRPAARGRIRFMEETLVLDVEIAYRGVVGIGGLADSFGQGVETHGVDLSLALTGNLARIADLGFTWAARFAYVGYFMNFAGAANDAMGSSGVEESLRFTLLAGWSF